MEICIPLLCVTLFLWIAWRWQRISLFQNLGIPGPKPNLIFGNLLELYKKGPIKCHEEWVMKYGRVLGYYYGMKPVLLVTDPYLLKDIFIKDFPKFINREPFNPLFRYNLKKRESQSITNLSGRVWKGVRCVLTPTFTMAKMKQMAGSIDSSIHNMMNCFREQAEKGEEFEIFDVYRRLTLDVITKTAFGIQTDVQKNPTCSLLRASKIMFYASYEDPIIFIGLTFPLLRRLCEKLQDITITIMNRGRSPDKVLREGIRDAMALRRSNPQTRKIDLLQLMLDTLVAVEATEIDVSKLEAGNAEIEKLENEETTNKKTRVMTDGEIESSAFVVLLAGYETTSTALAFTTYLLAKHQDVQDKLYQEIKQLIDHGEKLEYATISKLPYLDKVLCESLRLFPPVYLFTNRIAIEDVQYGDILIPKGMITQAPVHLMHHDSEFWSEPEIFDPERFNSKPNTDGITYLPFGVGPRNCLGMRFAQLEMKLAIAHTIYKFQIKMRSTHKDGFEMKNRVRTLTPATGVYVKLETRKEN